jgi:hypothetical protein
MESCVKCGRPGKEGLKFCTGCGTKFPERGPAPEQTAWPGAGPASARRAPPRRPLRAVWLGAASVVLLAGIAVGIFLLVNHKTAGVQKSALSGSDRPLSSVSARPSPTAISSPPPSASPEVTPSASPEPGAVTVASAAARNPEAPPVADFIGMYFSAINSRGYRGYISLFTAQDRPALTAAQFAQDYRTTTDSDETLTGLSTAAGGDIVAAVTFTSHQAATESVTGTQTCTDWTVSFYLVHDGGGYLIDHPPASYHAAYAAC